VDVWDALLSDRPYRKAWTLKKVIRHIGDQAGKAFDPQIVEVFLGMMAEQPGSS
jgi:HD-GYP domain-containing protein (c-di-GMP phosphodiesterase class II)